MSRLWRIGTRGSQLAQLQTEIVIQRLKRVRPRDQFEPVIIRTAGDRDLHRPISSFNTWGVFVKEIERALLAGEIDLAVHSAKDLTTESDPGLVVGAFLPRGPVHDILITRQQWESDPEGLPQLPSGARLGTSSVRRQGQLREWRPDLQLENLRGNVETRLRKLFDLELDGIVLAAAGLMRLNLLPANALNGFQAAKEPVPLLGGFAYRLDPRRFVPAAGQGVLAIQVRASDEAALQLVAELDDAATRTAQEAERAFMLAMGASCAVPIGAWARREANCLHLVGYYSDSTPARQQIIGPTHRARELGRELAERMKRDIPDAARTSSNPEEQ